MSIFFETDGPIAIVTIDRPEVRNCVDGPTALDVAAGAADSTAASTASEVATADQALR